MDNQENNEPLAQENSKGWERETLEKLVFSAVNEQKKARRWGIFFKCLTFTYLLVILGVALYPQIKLEMTSGVKKHAAVIDIYGVIAEGELASADNIIQGLRDAVKDENTQGIILNINSPGGSPVQADYVFNEILRLREEYPKIPIYSVVTDICASGGYYIAAASDRIFVNKASLIGSIGVLMNGFGFVEVLEKLGVERRLMTAGKHKAMMDPFSPLKQGESAHMQGLLDQVHQQFIDAVRLGRGERLMESDEIFSGLIWNGQKSVEIGLADDFGSVDSVAKNILDTEHKLNFTPQETLMERLTGKFAASFGKGIASLFTHIQLQ